MQVLLFYHSFHGFESLFFNISYEPSLTNLKSFTGRTEKYVYEMNLKLDTGTSLKTQRCQMIESVR